MKLNYQAICNNLLRGLPPRSRDVLEGRFGLGQNPEVLTLDAIGQEYGICRERVRQIEEDGFKQIKESSGIHYQKPLQYIENYIRQNGGLKKEASLISELSSDKEKNSLLFLLSLGEQFQKFREDKEFYSFWAADPNSIIAARGIISDFIKALSRSQKPLTLEQYIRTSPSARTLNVCPSGKPFLKEKGSIQNFRTRGSPPTKNLVGGKIPAKALFSYLEISKLILRTLEGRYGLADWPEINPRGVKDMAYIVFKQTQKPLHFVEVAKNLAGPAHIQTVHNELIKDQRFVLVGRGIYALREWGYQPGTVKEVIAGVLKKAKKPLPKLKILEDVQKQRLVKENTILLNLNNKEYFLRDHRGKYYIREA